TCVRTLSCGRRFLELSTVAVLQKNKDRAVVARSSSDGSTPPRLLPLLPRGAPDSAHRPIRRHRPNAGARRICRPLAPAGKRHGPPIAIFLSPLTSPELDGEVCHRSITNRVHLVNEQCSCRQTDDSPTPHSELACHRWNLRASFPA
ncbi:hypothetical protein MUK42_34605, partial [Musa troglodytarum]